jgi:hypothetical protein
MRTESDRTFPVGAILRLGQKNKQRGLFPTREVFSIIVFVASFVAVTVASCMLAAYVPIPDYGTWTGIQPLERKMGLLEKAAKQGRIDALILSSSIGDHGVSAATLQEQTEKSMHSAFRCFNFSTGAATFRTFPLLYRLARTVSKPRSVFLFVTVDASYGDSLRPRTPEYILSQAPVGGAINSPIRLGISRLLWDLAIIKKASAIRDYSLFGWFKNRVPSHADLYSLSESGDTLNYTFSADSKALNEYADGRREVLLRCLNAYTGLNSPTEKRRIFLSDTHLQALMELKALVGSDGGSLTIVTHEQASALTLRDDRLALCRRAFSESIERTTSLKVLDFLDEFHPYPYEIADPVHLNQYGARRFSRLVAAHISGQIQPEGEHQYAFPNFNLLNKRGKNVSTWASIVAYEASAKAEILELRTVQSWQTMPLPVGYPVRLLLTSPINIELPLDARVTSKGTIVADAKGISQRDSIFVVSIVSSNWTPLSLPLAGYRWLGKAIPDSIPETRSPELKVTADEIRPNQRITVSWINVGEPAKDDWIGLFPWGMDDRERIDFRFTGGGSEGRMEFAIPLSAKPGEYCFRMFQKGGWQQLAVSKPIKVVK